VPAANAFSQPGSSVEKDLPNAVTLGNVLNPHSSDETTISSALAAVLG
jgi:hypothetical protein